MSRQKGLGRGLDALLGDTAAAAGDVATHLEVERLQPGRYQPRTRMDPDSLDELAASIRSQGIIQPIVVRPIDQDGYEIIAGERRWRAAQLAGLATVPVLIRKIPDDAALAISLIENIQREELNALEEAAGVNRLINEFGLTHQQAADALGRSRSATSNLLRLLQLPPSVQDYVMEGSLDMGHARALLPLAGHQQLGAASEIVKRRLSVREAELLVKRLLDPAQPRESTKDPDVARLEASIADRLGTTTHLKHSKSGKGTLVLQYSSLDHLQSLLDRILTP